jgi:hypothetical protein
VPRDIWEAAATLADRLGALPAFVAGLRLAPTGEAILQSLDVSAPLTVELALRGQGDLPVALGLSRLIQTRGVAAKTRLLARELWPTPAYMRVWSQFARRGRVGLAAAYVIRPIWLAWRLGPALLAQWRARRARP